MNGKAGIYFERAAQTLVDVLHEFGGAWLFMGKVVRIYRKTSGYGKPIIAQVAEVSMRTMSTVIFAGVFVGAILVLQFDAMLRRFDAQALLGGLNTSATIREVGPLIISFLLAGKIGAYTTAELFRVLPGPGPCLRDWFDPRSSAPLWPPFQPSKATLPAAAHAVSARRSPNPRFTSTSTSCLRISSRQAFLSGFMTSSTG